MLPGIFSGVVATVFHIHIYGREAGQGKGVQSGGGYKARKGKARENETRRSEDRSEDLRENKQHSWLVQFTQDRPGERET